MFVLIVLSQLVYGVDYLLFDVIDLLIHNQSLIGRHVLQLREQLPHVDVQHLQLLFQLPHGERVQMQGMGAECE